MNDLKTIKFETCIDCKMSAFWGWKTILCHILILYCYFWFCIVPDNINEIQHITNDCSLEFISFNNNFFKKSMKKKFKSSLQVYLDYPVLMSQNPHAHTKKKKLIWLQLKCHPSKQFLCEKQHLNAFFYYTKRNGSMDIVCVTHFNSLVFFLKKHICKLHHSCKRLLWRVCICVCIRLMVY